MPLLRTVKFHPSKGEFRLNMLIADYFADLCVNIDSEFSEFSDGEYKTKTGFTKDVILKIGGGKLSDLLRADARVGPRAELSGMLDYLISERGNDLLNISRYKKEVNVVFGKFPIYQALHLGTEQRVFYLKHKEEPGKRASLQFKTAKLGDRVAGDCIVFS